MECIQIRLHRIRNINRRPKIRHIAPVSFHLKLRRAVNAIINRLRAFNHFMEKFLISCFCLRTRLVCKIFFQLFNIRSHIFWPMHIFIHTAAIYFDDVFQKTNQRLRVHNDMIRQKVYAAKPVRRFDHHHAAHWRIFSFKRNLRPLPHCLFRFFHRRLTEILQRNFLLYFVYHILIPDAFFVFCKLKPHRLAPFIRL